jgi:hypothetical protein
VLRNLREQAPELRRILEGVNSELCCEDGLYRYYHGSLKMFSLETATQMMADALAAVAPEGRPFHIDFSSKSSNEVVAACSRWRTASIGRNAPVPSSRPFSTPDIFWRWP